MVGALTPMPRLIVLNGPPGIGKSTVARRFVDEHPLSLCLDLDVVRALLGGWRDDLEQSGRRARALAIEMAHVHLQAGHDVVIPQLLAQAPFLEELERLAAEVGASFHEIVLVAPRSVASARLQARSRARTQAGEPDEPLSSEAMDDVCDRLDALVAHRRSAILVAAPDGGLDDTYARVVGAVS
jgi:predicted kinase